MQVHGIHANHRRGEVTVRMRVQFATRRQCMDMSVARTELEKRTEFRVIGNSTTRHDAYEKVTGSATFGTDLSFPKMLHGKILWSKVAHARLVKTDTSKAEQLPGVKAIITANDFPEVRFGSVIADQTV